MGTYINSSVALGMVVGILVFFPIRKLRLYSGLFVALTGALFALPVMTKIYFDIGFLYPRVPHARAIILICYYLIYANYILYIMKIVKRTGRKF